MNSTAAQEMDYTIVQTLFSESYCLAAALTLCVFDWTIRVGQEIDFIWRRQFSTVTVLYIILQTVTIASLGLQCYGNIVDLNCGVTICIYTSKLQRHNSPSPSSTPCSAITVYLTSMGAQAAYSTTVAVISALRVYAISHRNAGLAGLVCALLLVRVAYEIYDSVTTTSTQAPAPFYCAIGSASPVIKPDCDRGVLIRLLLAAMAATIAGDSIILLTTWLRTYQSRRLARELEGIDTPLHTLLLRDGTIYFGSITLFNVLNMVFGGSTVFWKAAEGYNYFGVAFSEIILLRFFLNLRAISDGDTNETLGDNGQTHHSRSSIRFSRGVQDFGSSLHFMNDTNAANLGPGEGEEVLHASGVLLDAGKE